MLCVLSLLLSIGFLALHLPAALLLGPMIAGSSSVCASRSATSPLRFSRCPSHSWLHDCTKPHWFDSHHAGRQLADRACDFTGDAAFRAIVGWLLVRYSSLHGNTGTQVSSHGGAAAMVAMAQDTAQIFAVAFMQYLRVLFVAGPLFWSPTHDAGR